MDIKVEIKEEPVCPNGMLTQFKSEYEETDNCHSERVFISSHFVQEYVNIGEMCNKAEIKEDPYDPESISNESIQEMELCCATNVDMKNGIKEVAAHADEITGDVTAEEISRLHTESLHRNRDVAHLGENTLRKHDPCISNTQLYSSSQSKILEGSKTCYMLNSDENVSVIKKIKKQQKCDVCGKRFRYLSDLKKHSVSHEKKQFKCDICQKSFTQAYNVKIHKLIHEGKRPHTCKICNKSFTQASNLNQHKLIHEGKRLHTCEVCNRSFTQASQLKMHKLTHDGKRVHICVICNRGFVHAFSLRQHKLIHEGKRVNKCDICHKSFTLLSYLRAHVLIHEGKRPHVCDVCNNSFIHLSTLKRHKLIHENKRPHTCKICKKSFTQTSTLKRHTLTHERKTLRFQKEIHQAQNLVA